MTTRHLKARKVQDILEHTETLGMLKERLMLSRECLRAIEPLIPYPMRQAVHAGPVDFKQNGSETMAYWVLLADNTAVAAKLRQLQPLMLQYLEKKGITMGEVRVEVIPASSHL